MKERRRCQRMEPPYRITATVRAAERSRVLDLSPHGVLLETSVPLAPSSVCAHTLSLTIGELRLRAVVRSCRTAVDAAGRRLVFDVGFEFLSLETHQRKVLEDLLVEYCLIEVAGRYESVTVGKRH